MQDALPDVDGIDARCLVLQEAVREAAGGCAHVGAHATLRADAECLQRSLQLLAAARDKRRRRLQAELGAGVDAGGGLERQPSIDAHLARHHQALRLRAAVCQAALDEQEVETGFGMGVL